MPDQFCDDNSLVGTPARIRERYRAWEDGGASGLTINGDTRAIALMAEITGRAKATSAEHPSARALRLATKRVPSPFGPTAQRGKQ